MSTRNHNDQSIIGSFTIRISKYKGQYKIQAIGPNDVVEPESSPFIWLPDIEQKNTLRLFQHPIRVQSVSLAQLTDLGQAMYRAVFTPNIATAFGRVQAKLKESNGIRIRLLVEPPELAHLPWELMHDEHDFIALRSNYPLVRGTKDTLTTPEISIRGKLKILYVWASPEAEAELNLEESAERIQSLLAANKKIHFEILEKATLTKLRSKLDQGYHVLCFAGHGTSESIYLEKDNDKYADKVSGLTLARALEGTQTRLVFLAACETGTLAPSAQMTFGENLIHEANKVKAKVPSVVAMQYAVRDDQTNPLTARFFEALANFQPVDVALSQARKSILDEERQSMDVTRDVFAPVMHLQSESSNLFRKARNWLAIGFAIAFVIAALLGFVALLNAINSSATAVYESLQRQTAVAQQATAETARYEEEAARLETEQLSRIIRSGELAAEAQVALSAGYPQRSLLLGVEALYVTQNADEPYVSLAEQAIRDALYEVGGEGVVSHDSPFTDIQVSPSQEWLVTGDENGELLIWNLSTFESTRLFGLPDPDDSVSLIEVSPDGQWLVGGGAQGTFLWNLHLDKEPVLNLGTRITQAFFSSDNRWLITTGAFITILWELNNDSITSIQLNERGSAPFYPVSFSPDSRWVAASNKLWELNALNHSPVMLKEDTRVLTFSPDNRWLAVEEGDCVRLWNVQYSPPGETDALLCHNNTPITSLHFSTDGRLATTIGWDNSVSVWDITNTNQGTSLPSEILQFSMNEGDSNSNSSLQSFALFSPDSRWLVLGNGLNTSLLLQIDEQPTIHVSSTHTLRGHEGTVTTAVFDRWSRWLITASKDGTLRKWDLISPAPATTSPLRISAQSSQQSWAFFANNGRWILVYNNGISIYEVGRTRFEKPDFYLGGFSPIFGEDSVVINSDWVAVASEEAAVVYSLPDIITNQEPFLYDWPESNSINNTVKTIALSGNGQWLALSAGNDLTLWSLNHLNPAGQPISLEVDVMNETFFIDQLVFSPDSRWLVAGVDLHPLMVWNLSQVITDTYPIILATPDDFEANSVAFDTDSEWLAVGGHDTTYLWRIENAAFITKQSEPITLTTQSGPITALAFSPDGKWLATGGGGIELVTVGSQYILPEQWDNAVYLWNLEIPDPSVNSRRLEGHEDRIEEIIFTPDSQWLLSGSRDSTIRRWPIDDVNSSGSVVVLGTLPPGTGLNLNISQNGSRFLTSSFGDSVLLWTLDIAELLERACTAAGRNLSVIEWSLYFPDEPYRITCPHFPSQPSASGDGT